MIGNLRKAKIKNLSVPTGSDKDVCRLNVTVNNSRGVRGIQSISELGCEQKQTIRLKRSFNHKMLERYALQKFHGDKCLLLFFTNVVNGADVRMIQRRGCLGLAPKAREGLLIARKIGREKLQGDETMKPDVFSFVDHTHPAAAEFLDDAVVRDGLADHSKLRGLQVPSSYGRGIRESTNHLVRKSHTHEMRVG